jgi:hypothetical protein
MPEYSRIVLTEMLKHIGEDEVVSILSDYSCPVNSDVEDFIRHKAVSFARQGIASTHLIFAQYMGEEKLVGYFALANKQITISQRAMDRFGSTLQKRLKKFAAYDEYSMRYVVSAPLIGQLGKNFKYRSQKLITGDELLKIALDTIGKVQIEVGGKFVYLECEDIPALTEFYSSNGFVEFNRRTLDRDEAERASGKYYLQWLKYLK